MTPNDLKGKFFNFDIPPGGAINAGNRTGLDRGIKRRATRHIHTHLRATPGGPSLATWRFKYLEYWAGAITRTRLNEPVLTGPMSGCILCRYNNKGETYFAHIGTDSDNAHPNTIDVKNDWTSYIGGKTNANVMGRKPSHVITDLDVYAEAVKGGGNPRKYEVWGYVTQSDAMALLIQRSDRFNNAVSSRIVLARPMLLVPWQAIPGSW